MGSTSETRVGEAPSPARAVSEASRFLVELAETMQGVGYPANTTEAAMRRAARAMDFEIEVLVLQSLVLIEVRRGETATLAMRRLPLDFRYRLHLVHDIEALVDALARGKMDVSAGAEALCVIRSRTNVSTALFLAGGAVYSAAVAARLGGAWLEMLVAAFIALGGRIIGQSQSRYVSSSLVRTFIVGLAGALVTFAVASTSSRALDAPAALFGGVTLMVPSMVMTMAAHELGGDRLETGSLRLAYALLRFVMLAAGIVAAVRAWNTVFGVSPPTASAAELPWWLMTTILVVGGAGLTMSLRAAYRDMPPIIGGVLIGVAAQMASEAVLGEGSFAPLVSAFVVGAVAYHWARVPGHVASAVIVPGLLQLVPGFLGTQTVFALLSGRATEEHQTVLHVLLVTVQLAAGLALASGLFRRQSDGDESVRT